MSANNNNNNNNNIHICIAPYGRNFRGAKCQLHVSVTMLPALAVSDHAPVVG